VSSTVTLRLAAIVLGAIGGAVFAPRSANAEAGAPEPAPEPAPAQARRPYELGAHFDYRRAWTTGLDPYGAGIGISAGFTARFPLYLGARATHYYGSYVSAIGPGTVYQAHDSADTLDAQVAWVWRPLRRLVLRPGLGVGADLVHGSTLLQNETLADGRLVFGVGPVVQARWEHDWLVVGIDADGRFVPAQPAAQRFGAALTWGLRL